MKIRKSILYYLTELLIVAFGVFLGILVSEYNNSNKLEKNVSKSRELIIKEIESNLVALNDGIRYHETIKVGFDQMRKNLNGEVVLTPYFTNTGFRFEQIDQWNGIGIVELDATAFESAKLAGVLQYMDIDEVKHISSAYKTIHSTQEFGTMITQKLMAMDSESKVLDIIGVLELLTNDFLNIENNAVIELKNTMAVLKKENN